jgi:transposase
MPPQRSPELSLSLRGRILMLHDLNYSYREISKILKVPKSTCYDTVRRDNLHHTCQSLPRSGRPHTINDRTRRTVLRNLRSHRFEPYSTIAALCPNVNTQQVKKIAHQAGYHRRIARRKPFLSPVTVKKRLAWAIENQSRDWQTVIWTDESSIPLGGIPITKYVTRRPKEEYLPNNIQPTFQSGRKSIMVWGAIADGVKGPLIKIECSEVNVDKSGRKKGGGFGGKQYVKQVLEGPLSEFIAQMKNRGHQEILVIEDGAPAHRSNAAKTARSRLGIKTINHPPFSPDLNPIEPIWAILKSRISNTPGSRNSLEMLWDIAQKVWGEISEEEVSKHTNAMGERVAAVKAAKCQYTKF